MLTLCPSQKTSEYTWDSDNIFAVPCNSTQHFYMVAPLEMRVQEKKAKGYDAEVSLDLGWGDLVFVGDPGDLKMYAVLWGVVEPDTHPKERDTLFYNTELEGVEIHPEKILWEI